VVEALFGLSFFFVYVLENSWVGCGGSSGEECRGLEWSYAICLPSVASTVRHMFVAGAGSCRGALCGAISCLPLPHLTNRPFSSSQVFFISVPYYISINHTEYCAYNKISLPHHHHIPNHARQKPQATRLSKTPRARTRR